MRLTRTSDLLARFAAGLLLASLTTSEVRGEEPPAPSTVAGKHLGRFISDEPRFPFVLQVTTRGDLMVVRGLGRMAYSADDPTLIMTEFVGIGLAGDQPALRGILTLHPDGANLKEPKLTPWVGVYSSARDDWQLMLSPEYVVGVNREGVTANREDEPAAIDEESSSECGGEPTAATNNGGIDIDKLVSNIDKGLQLLQDNPNTVTQLVALNQMHTDAQAAAARAHAHLSPAARASLAATRASLASQWNQLTMGVAGYGNRMSQAARTAGQPSQAKPPRPPADTDMSAQDVRTYIENASIVRAAIQRALGDPDWATDLPDSLRGGNTPTSPPPNQVSAGPPPVAPPTPHAPTTPKPPAVATPAVPSVPSTGSTPPTRSAPSGGGDLSNLTDKPLDEVLTTFLGGNSNRFSYTLVPAPEPSRAWQVVRVNRLPDGRIEIVNYGSAPDRPNAPQGGTGTTPGGSSPAVPPSSTGGTTSTGGTGSGSNLVAGSPPNVPPAGPGTPPTAPTTRTPPPPPPTVPPLVPLSGRSATPTTGSGERYIPGVTVLVNEDGGTSAPGNDRVTVPNLQGMRAEQAVAALGQLNLLRGAIMGPPYVSPEEQGIIFSQAPAAGTQVAPGTTVFFMFWGQPQGFVGVQMGDKDQRQLIDDARRAFNAAAGVHALTKGPKADDHHHADAPGAKPDEKKPHPLAGTWELTGRVGGLQSATHTITVAGQTIRLQGSSTDMGGIAVTYSGEGTLTDQGNGTSRAELTLTYNSVGAKPESITIDVSNDGSTMTTRSANGTLTWRRTSPASSPPKPGASEPHHDAPAPVSSGGAAHHAPPTTSPRNSAGPSLSQSQLDAARNALTRVVGRAAHSPPGSLDHTHHTPPAAGSPARPADGDHHHDAPGAKPDDKKTHPLEGTWKYVSSSGVFPAGYAAVATFTVNGQSVGISGSYTVPDFGTSENSGEGTINGLENGAFTLRSKTPGGAGTTTVTFSADNSTMTLKHETGSSTWHRVK